MLLLLLLLLLVSVGVASGESPANVSLSWSGLIEVVTGLGWTQQVGAPVQLKKTKTKSCL